MHMWSFRGVQHKLLYATSVRWAHTLRHAGLRTHTCGDLNVADVGQSVVLCGWIQQTRRVSGSLLFVPLRDAYGATQLTVSVDSKGNAERKHALIASLAAVAHDSVVRVTGTVRARPHGMANAEMATGDVEVDVSEFEVLNECGELPFPTGDKVDVSRELLRLQYRYVDLRRPCMQRNLRVRSDVGRAVRECFAKHGFVEVETPTLFKRTPEGAREFLVPTRGSGQFFALPQSPQQFKQMLMVGGIDRYFQFARCYRDEDLRADRQPEFTQIDLELSFATAGDVQAVTEDLVMAAWSAAGRRPSVGPPFPRLKYADAMEWYGVDKPDTRFDMKIADVSRWVPLRDGSRGGRVRAFALPGRSWPYSRAEMNDFSSFIDSDTGLRLPVTVAQVMSPGSWRSRLDKHLSEEAKRAVEAATGAPAGAVIVFCEGADGLTSATLGRARILAADWSESKGVPVRDSTAFNFLWVEDFPLFEPTEDGTGLQSVHHPFTAPQPEDVSRLQTHPLEVRGQHYDLVVNGWELGGGSIRVHDSELQRRIFEILKANPDTFRHLLDALRLGAPPHGGLALGFDRMIAILCGLPSIRDAIAFPKSRAGVDLTVGAPSSVAPDILSEYGLALTSGQDNAVTR